MLKLKKETKFKDIPGGEIPKDWEKSSLEEVAHIDRTPKEKCNDKENAFIGMEDIFIDGYVPKFEVRTFDNIRSGKEVSPSSLLVAKITPSFEHGKMCIVPNITSYRWFATTEVFSVEPKKNTKILFIYYLIKHSSIKEILENAMGGTSGRERVQLSAFKSLAIPYPPPPEQCRIATVLAWFDDLIENKKRQNEILEATAMSLFKSWFVNFDPFKNDRFAPSELGEIPKGWEVKPIGELAELLNGFSYTSAEKFEEYVEGSYVFITLNNAVEGGGFKPEYFWINSGRLRERHFLEEGDLIITNVHFGVGGSETGRLLAAPAIVTFPAGYPKEKGVYSMDVTRVSPLEKNYKYYLYLYLRATREDSASFSTGTSILHLDLNNFRRNKLVICPHKPVLDKFHPMMEPLFDKIRLNQKEMMVLKKVRDTLLPLLVFGRLRVEEL